MPERERDFFILLRAGLWQRAEGGLSPAPEWEYIYRLSVTQNVLGVIVEGITLMNVPDRIPAEIFQKFLIGRATIEKNNIQVNALQSRLCRVLNEEEVPYVILKGQAVGQSYFKPGMRSSGDIDFLVDTEDCHRTIGIFSKYADDYRNSNEKTKHHQLKVRGTLVEIHGAARAHFTQRFDAVLENERRIMFAEKSFHHYQHNGTSISIPNPDYTALFLFGHILRHFSTRGISLKQLCDWVMYIHTHISEIKIHEFRKLLKDAGIGKVWGRFSAFAVEWLGAQPDDILDYNPEYSKYGIDIWRPMKELSMAEPRKKHSPNYWSILMDDYCEVISKKKYVWRISKADYFRTIYAFFSPMVPVFFRKAFRIGGDRFHKDRFGR